jgi:hypothetical protein
MSGKLRMAKAALRANQRDWERRHHRGFPWRTRWHVFRARRRVRASWREWWLDVVYLVRG